jgi:hypothetical protein
MSEEPKINYSPHLKSDSVVTIKVATRGGVITGCVRYCDAAAIMHTFHSPPSPMPRTGGWNEPVTDIVAEAVVPGTIATWLWSEVAAIWVEPMTPSDEAGVKRTEELKRSNDLYERDLALRERESHKPREPWEGDE